MSAKIFFVTLYAAWRCYLQNCTGAYFVNINHSKPSAVNNFKENNKIRPVFFCIVTPLKQAVM